MPLDHTASPVRTARITDLRKTLHGLDAPEILRVSLGSSATGRMAVVSSFGADSVVLLHMLAQIDPATVVLFVDTQMLFPETLAYQQDVARALGLLNVRQIRARPQNLHRGDPDDALHKTDTDACCDLRKTAPLEQALAGFDSWITGRKRFQSDTRAALEVVETEQGRIKINPLAGWQATDLLDYIAAHDLPRNPLVAKGFPSIGCAPCTSAVRVGEPSRAGRWRGHEKHECGIHFSNGPAVRATAPPGAPAPASEAQERIAR
ncbi:MAG: phosphoadenosine phosphosulfate reductase [Paracoccaceae bacterium]|jgi:phosphoadenosine phosphosulfate reductase